MTFAWVYGPILSLFSSVAMVRFGVAMVTFSGLEYRLGYRLVNSSEVHSDKGQIQIKLIIRILRTTFQDEVIITFLSITYLNDFKN